MIESDHNLTVNDFITELDQVSEPPTTIFTQLYGES